jgi:outer membrane lipoprotein-sorting protein
VRRFAPYLLVLVSLVSGCAALKAPVEPVLPALAHPVSIRARATVEVKRTMTLTGRAVVLAKSPGSFRIEVQGPFGSAAALLVSDGKTVYLMSGGEAKRYGTDDPLFPYSFSPEEAVSFLTGGPITAEGCGCEVSRDANGRVSMVTKPGNGPAALTVTMTDYRAVDGAEVPFDIKITNRKGSLHIKYASVEVNPDLNADSFDTEGLP